MGIAEIQAALASAPPAAVNPFAAPAPAAPAAFQPQPLPAPAAAQAPAAFQPNPFAAPPAAAPNPFGGSAPAPAFGTQVGPGVAPAPAQAAPPGFNASASVGFQTQATLAQPAQATFAFNPPAGFNPATTPPINPPGERASLNSVGATGAPAELAADVAQNFTRPADPASLGPQPVVEPKRRGRKPKAEPAITITAQTGVQAVDLGTVGDAALQSPAELVLGNISTEDLVAVLRERGYSVWLEAKS